MSQRLNDAQKISNVMSWLALHQTNNYDFFLRQKRTNRTGFAAFKAEKSFGKKIALWISISEALPPLFGLRLLAVVLPFSPLFSQ